MARTLNNIDKTMLMKRLATLLCIAMLLSIGAIASGQEDQKKEKETFQYRKVENTAFKVGEILEYKLAYGIINAGVASLEVKKSEKKIQDREILHIVGEGKSISAFDWFFKVRDRYETYIDEEGIFPWLFVRRISEGGYDKSQDYMFYQNKGKVKNEDNEVYEVPHGIQDMLSSFYYARTIDFTGAKKGDIFVFDSFVDEEIYPLRIKYAGTKTVKIKMGKFDCMVFHPVVQEGRIFETDDDLTVYITNDENKIPILARAKILVGSIRMELTGYENLANPVAKK
jgi:hypothetical protein